MIVYISDFDLKGSGYMNIAVSLCSQLTQRGHEVMALGLGYSGQPHDYPFTIVPAQLPELIPMVRQLQAQGVPVEALVVALDIPLQERLLDQLQAPTDIPYIGLFPLEAGPVCGPWAMQMMRMDARLVMSDFGREAMAAAGVEGETIPVGIDTEAWRAPLPAEREMLRQGMGVGATQTVILTVADNQERKNLSRSLEIFADFAQDHDALYWLVTRPNSPVGWRLDDYALGLGIFERLILYERGMSFKDLWSLYAASDVFLLTSKAEGLALPVLEAMACRLPVVGTDCTAIREHLRDGRGLLIKPDYVHIDPFGNSKRYLASRSDGAICLEAAVTMAPGARAEMLDAARAYVHRRDWSLAGETLAAAIERIRERMVA